MSLLFFSPYNHVVLADFTHLLVSEIIVNVLSKVVYIFLIGFWTFFSSYMADMLVMTEGCSSAN